MGFGGFACKEIGGEGGEHFHWILFTDKTIKAIRSSLTRTLPVSGNGSYSLTVCRDVEKYQRYMCKGTAEGSGPDIVWSNGLGFDFEVLHQQYWSVHKELKRKRENTATFVLEECKRTGVRWNDRIDISKIYIKALSDQNKPINLFTVRSNVNLIQTHLCPTEAAIEELARQI